MAYQFYLLRQWSDEADFNRFLSAVISVLQGVVQVCFDCQTCLKSFGYVSVSVSVSNRERVCVCVSVFVSQGIHALLAMW